MTTVANIGISQEELKRLKTIDNELVNRLVEEIKRLQAIVASKKKP